VPVLPDVLQGVRPDEHIPGEARLGNAIYAGDVEAGHLVATGTATSTRKTVQ
jgi:hypothetical protein